MRRFLVILSILIIVLYLLPLVVMADDKQNVYLYVARNLFENGQFDKALLNYEKAYEFGKIPTRDLALMAICYIKVKKFDKAQSLIKKGLEENPDNPLLKLAEGILNFDKKNYEKAYKSFSEAYKVDNTLVQAKRGMVSSLVNMGVRIYKSDKRKAKKYFMKAVKLNPAFIPALQNLAVISFENGNIKEALDYIEKALKYDPKNVKILELKYFIYYREKDYKNQAKVLLRLVVLYPGNPEYWTMLGKAYEETGQIKKSIEAYMNARRFNSSNPYPYYRLAEYYFNEKRDRTKAVYILREGIGKAVYMIGQIRMSAMSELQGKKEKLTKEKLKKIEEMAKTIEKPKKILSESLTLLRKLSGKDDKYEKELAHLIELYPHTVELQIALGKLYMENGNYKDAIKLWRYILIKHSRNIEAYKGISYCYMKLGKTDKAIKSYKIALDINSEDSSIYESLIELYSKEDKLKTLYDDWRERLYMDKRNPVLLRALAKVEKLLGKNEEAEKHLKRADIVERENKEYEEKQKAKNKN